MNQRQNKGEAKMANQDTENIAKELKGESPMPVPYARGKANATINDLAPAHQVRKAPKFPVATFILTPLAGWLVSQGYVTMFEAHKMGYSNRV